MAASINPSDVKNVAGGMKQTTLPRIPGRDFSGVVEAGPADWVGAEVWGTGGDAGSIRDGSHAELIGVPVASLRRKPDALSFDQAAAVGVNYIAAWCGIEAAGLKAGETVFLIGAGGGVGGAAAQVARHLGARVIGADRHVPHPDELAAGKRMHRGRPVLGPSDVQLSVGEVDRVPAPQQPTPYSITSSATVSILSGMVRPSAFAVLRFITSSNLTACTTGRSAGLAPMRIFPA